MPETFRVRNVDEAIELSSKFRREGRYDWFRGQVNAEWKPYPSLMRRELHEPGAIIQPQMRLMRFMNWLIETPGLEPLARDADVIMAIAQHHGIPTHYLDFTTDPAVAGFFAADAKSLDGIPESCIFCLDSKDLIRFWTVLRDVVPEVPEIALAMPDVSNLWRLQAQRGVFLFAPTNWDLHYPMDRIVFPPTGYPAYPTQKDIYPDGKSQLELLLDHFFDNEQKLESAQEFSVFFEEMKKTNQNVSHNTMTAPAHRYHPEYIAGGKLEPHSSWDAIEAWLTVPEEIHGDVWRREERFKVSLGLGPLEAGRRFRNGVLTLLERRKEIRHHLIAWQLDVEAATEPRPSLVRGLSVLWDGLRRLPISESLLADALGNWVALYAAGFDTVFDGGSAERIFAGLFGEAIHLEVAAPDGASSRGYMTTASVREAFRSDLSQVLTEDARKKAESLHLLLQMISSPQRLFEFPKLIGPWVTHFIPSQMVRSAPHFFSPARLDALGVP